MKRRFVVNYIDPETGANSAIDNVIAEENYTAADYIRDCEKNSDPEYIDMLHAGSVELDLCEDWFENVCDFIRAHRADILDTLREAWIESVTRQNASGVIRVYVVRYDDDTYYCTCSLFANLYDYTAPNEYIIASYECTDIWDIMYNGMDDFYPDILTESEKNAIQMELDPDELYLYDDYDVKKTIEKMYPNKWDDFSARFAADTADLIRHSFDEDIDAALERLAD